MPALLSARSRRFFLNRRADQIPPLRPRSVVILHPVVTQQILQHEPGMRTALADAAIGDHFIVARDSLALIELLQGVGRLEGAVLCSGLRPGYACGAGDMAAALRGFRHSRRRDYFAAE